MSELEKHPDLIAGYIYGIRQARSHYLKIGKSKHDPALRLRALQIGNPTRLTLEFVIPTYNFAVAETYVHEALATHRTSGEWFRVSPWSKRRIRRIAALACGRAAANLIDSIYTRYEEEHSEEESRVINAFKAPATLSARIRHRLLSIRWELWVMRNLPPSIHSSRLRQCITHIVAWQPIRSNSMLTRLADTLAHDAQARAAAAAAALLLGVLIGLVALIIAGAPDKAQATPPIIVIDATPTAQPMIAVYAAPGGAQLGQIPANLPIRYRDSRAPGWVGVDWDGAVVWFLADGDASTLADLAPQPTATTAPVVAEQPAPQVIYVERPAAAPPTADLCTPETCDPAAAPTVCAANACWSAAAPEVVYVPAFGGRDQRAAEPQSGDPGFRESFRDSQDAAFAASFRNPGCSQFIGYLPGDPCYRP